MKDTFNKLPLSEEAPQGLRNKVEYASRQPNKPSWFNGGFKLAAAGTAVAATIAAAVIFMTPATAQAKSWDMVTDAYDDIKSMLIQIDMQDGDSSENITVAFKGKDWRVAVGDEMDVSFSRGELLIYDADSQKAQAIDMGALPIPIEPSMIVKEIMEEISITKLLDEAADEIGKENISISAIRSQDGRDVYDVEINDPESGSNVFFTIDAKSDLPLSVKVMGIENGEQVLEAQMSFSFNRDVPDTYLNPVLPMGVEIERIDMSKMMEGGDGGDMFGGMDFMFEDMDGGHGHGDNDVELSQAVMVS